MMTATFFLPSVKISTHFNVYSSPKDALRKIKSSHPLQRIHARIIKPADTIEFDHTSTEETVIHINLHSLHEEIYNAERFNDVTVMIIDYHMNEMNGIELCKQLQYHPAKKILLTGGIDNERVAIQAFNDGAIHRFINKSDPNFIEKLNQAITSSKETYFRDISAQLLQHLPSSIVNILQHPSHINLTRQLRDQHAIIEQYILDMNGSTLMLDAKGNSILLIIKSEADMANYCNIAEDQEAPEKYIKGLAGRSILPFFFTKDDYHLTTSEWNDCFHICKAIPGMSKYYYSVIEDTDGRYIRKKEINPYTEHQQECMN
jgi:DNA-binding NarL/FixJ family response regulator